MQNSETNGAIIVQWRQTPGQTQATEVVSRSLRYYERLQSDGDIQSHRVFLGLDGGLGTAVLEGNVDRLIDLIKRPDHRNFLLTCQVALPEFRAIVSVGGANGSAQEVLRLVSNLQQQAQDTFGGNQQREFATSSSSGSRGGSTQYGNTASESRWPV